MNLYNQFLNLWDFIQYENLFYCVQKAIEYYNRETDEEHQTYYIEKLSKLNDEIRVIVDR